MGKWANLAQKTYDDLQKRKRAKEKGKKAVVGLTVENAQNIRRKMNKHYYR